MNNVGHCARNFAFLTWLYPPSNLMRTNTNPRRTEASCVDYSVFSPLCSIRYFWRRHPQLRGVELHFISLFWPSLPTGIQAAYEDSDRDLVFLFKGNCRGFHFVLVLPEGRGKGFFVASPKFRGGEPVRVLCWPGFV